MAAEILYNNAQGFRRDVKSPRVAVPAEACDCHMHVVGPFDQFPLRETAVLAPPEATVQDYVHVQKVTGLGRNVVVQPSFFARDNACTLFAVGKLGSGARAVVVVDADVDATTLRKMHAQGARGVRLQAVVAGGTSIAHMERIAQKIAPLGWHIQLYVDSDDVDSLSTRIKALPVPVVFDHMAHAKRGGSMQTPGFHALLRLVEEGVAWVKLSGARFAPSADRATTLIKTNPTRMLWGSDWPHCVYEEDLPEEGDLLDRLASWVPDLSVRDQILVDNPATLYFSA